MTDTDSVKAYINVETPTSTIALKKTSEDCIVAGISFHIKGDSFDKTVKTDANGKGITLTADETAALLKALQKELNSGD